MRNLLEPEHLLVILLVVVLLFGGQKLPEIGAALGRGVRDFQRAVDGDHAAPEPPAAPTPDPVPRAAEAEHEPKRLLP